MNSRANERIRDKCTPVKVAAHIIADVQEFERSPAATSIASPKAASHKASFLIRRAKTIKPELNVEQEMKRVRDKWKASVEELRIKK